MKFGILGCFVGDLSYHIEDEKMSSTLCIDDIINLQIIIKAYIQLYITTTMACHLAFWSTFSLLLMTDNRKLVSKKVTSSLHGL